jgi:hypothetical protein
MKYFYTVWHNSASDGIFLGAHCPECGELQFEIRGITQCNNCMLIGIIIDHPDLWKDYPRCDPYGLIENTRVILEAHKRNRTNPPPA